MSNYYIVGGDGRQYGPITDTEVRKWAAEGRLNEHTQARSENDTEWRTLSAFPEFTDIFGFAPAPDAPPVETFSLASLAEQDYELDLLGCIVRGWNLMKENFGTLFFSFLLAALTTIAFVVGVGLTLTKVFFGGVMPNGATDPGMLVGYNYFLRIVLAFVVSPLWAGCYLVFIKAIRGIPTGAGEIFEGFQRSYLQLFLGGLTISLIIGACNLPIDYIWQSKAGPVLQQLQQPGTDPTALQTHFFQLMSLFMSTLPIRLVCLIPATYLTVSWLFVLPLIIDRQMTFGAALKTSWKMVNKHFWQVFGLTILVGLVSVSGLLGCCIGVIFTIPIGMAASMIAYETIFRPTAKS